MRSLSINANNILNLIEDLSLKNFDFNDKRGFGVKITESNESYLFLAELPGVEKENVSIEFNKDGDLNIAVNQSLVEEINETQEKIIFSELKPIKAKRRFSFGNKVDSSKIVASFENGYLKLVLPKVLNIEDVKKIEII